MFKKWKDFISKRFSDREDLGKDEVYRRFWSDLPEAMAMEFFDEIESFYFLPAGLLRPDDDIKKLVEPDKPEKWYKPIKYELRFGELETELAGQLKKRMKQSNRYVELNKIQTVDDLMRVWCGEEPKTKRDT